MRYETSRNRSLIHYGVKGMKWGVMTKEYEPVKNPYGGDSRTNDLRSKIKSAAPKMGAGGVMKIGPNGEYGKLLPTDMRAPLERMSFPSGLSKTFGGQPVYDFNTPNNIDPITGEKVSNRRDYNFWKDTFGVTDPYYDTNYEDHRLRGKTGDERKQFYNAYSTEAELNNKFKELAQQLDGNGKSVKNLRDIYRELNGLNNIRSPKYTTEFSLDEHKDPLAWISRQNVSDKRLADLLDGAVYGHGDDFNTIYNDLRDMLRNQRVKNGVEDIFIRDDNIQSVGDLFDRAGRVIGNTYSDVSNWDNRTGQNIGNWANQAGQDVSKWTDQAGQDVSKWTDQAGQDVSKWTDQAGQDVAQAYDNFLRWIKGK